MKTFTLNFRIFTVAIGMAAILVQPVMANGPMGEHVNHLKENINHYEEEVDWLIGEIDGIVANYENKKDNVATSEIIEHWEAVDFHAAIESNYVPVYAKIWQGLYGIKQGIEGKKPAVQIRKEQTKLEESLWQALGAVKLAAQYQERGLLERVQNTTAGPATSVGALNEVSMQLDRVVAKYAEKLSSEATEIVHNTYLNLFEGVEGELIAQDAKLVEALEKDFNVTLPQAVESGASVEEVRKVVEDMQTKLTRAKTLLTKAEKDKKEVF